MPHLRKIRIDEGLSFKRLLLKDITTNDIIGGERDSLYGKGRG